MNSSSDPLEDALRSAPQPRPPAGLRAELLRQVNLPRANPTGAARLDRPTSWLKWWWPALAAGGFALAGLVWITFQQAELGQLRATLDELQRALSTPTNVPPAPETHEPSAVPIPDGQAELERLRAAVAGMRTDVAGLDALRAENDRLKAQAAAQAGISAEEYEQLAQAREKANRIQCVNNLKQLGLAARVWALDNHDTLPPNFLTMSNEIAAPKILICPGDTAHAAANSWNELSTGNISYEHLATWGDESEPDRVLFRCPVHGTVTLVDGSVQQIAKDRPELFTVRDGKTYLAPTPAPAPNPAQPATLQMDERMMRRYGLMPATNNPPNPASPTPAP